MAGPSNKLGHCRKSATAITFAMRRTGPGPQKADSQGCHVSWVMRKKLNYVKQSGVLSHFNKEIARFFNAVELVYSLVDWEDEIGCQR